MPPPSLGEATPANDEKDHQRKNRAAANYRNNDCDYNLRGVAAAQTKIKLPEGSTVTATIGIGPRSEGGFGITAELDVYLPGLADADASKLVETTHGICPYSNAIKASVDVKTRTRG